VNVIVIDALKHMHPDPGRPVVNWVEIIDDSQLDWMAAISTLRSSSSTMTAPTHNRPGPR
jgi:hypothetical protein